MTKKLQTDYCANCLNDGRLLEFVHHSARLKLECLKDLSAAEHKINDYSEILKDSPFIFSDS